MSSTLQAIILGIIEGLTEFLPISSTGHMIIAMPCLGIDPEADPWPAFLYFIQIGAIAAVVAYFWRPLWKQILTVPSKISNHLLVKLFVATIPAAAIGIPLNDWVEKHLEKPTPVAIALLIGALFMVIIERSCRRTSGTKIEEVTLWQALWIGLAQCISIIPGTSRAMATIMGGMIIGLPVTTAVEFSFYLAIPTICGAGLYRLVKYPEFFSGNSMTLLMTGFAVSFVSAWVVVAGFLRYVQAKRLEPFAIYRVALGIVVLFYWWH